MSSLARFVVLFNCNQTCLSRMRGGGGGGEGSLSTVSKGKQMWRARETTLMTDFISKDFYGAHDCVCEGTWIWLEDKVCFSIDPNAGEALKSTHYSSISVDVFFCINWNLPRHISNILIWLLVFSFLSSLELLATAGHFFAWIYQLEKISSVRLLISFIYLVLALVLCNWESFYPGQACWCITDLFH